MTVCFTACNVVYIGSYDMESLTGPQAIAKAVEQSLSSPVTPTVVHFKVSSQGVTLTDNKRKSVLCGLFMYLRRDFFQ